MFASDIRYIIKKIIIGVGIALCLIFLKGNLLMDVHAQASAIGTAGQVYSSCSNCHEFHVNLGSSWANWQNGDLTFNGAIYNYNYGYGGNGQERFTQIIANSYVVANDVPYACSFDSMNNPTMFYSNSQGDLSTYQTTGFSIRCKNISPGAKGIQSIHIQGLGLNDHGIGIRIYSPITFVTDDIQSQTSQITTNNTQNTDREIAAENENARKQLEETKKTNDTLNDDNVDDASDEGSSFFSDFSTTDHGGLSGIITAPLRLITAISSGSCNSLHFPLPFVNQNVDIDCMKPMYRTYFGSFYTLYQLITTGLISYWVCVKLLAWIRRLERPDDDKVEVLEL